MPYLVYCPTCNEKISVNAKQCPHCGEDKFIENKLEGYKEIIEDCEECLKQRVWESRYFTDYMVRSRYIRPKCRVCDGSGKIIKKKPIYKRIDHRKIV